MFGNPFKKKFRKRTMVLSKSRNPAEKRGRIEVSAAVMEQYCLLVHEYGEDSYEVGQFLEEKKDQKNFVRAIELLFPGRHVFEGREPTVPFEDQFRELPERIQNKILNQLLRMLEVRDFDWEIRLEVCDKNADLIIKTLDAYDIEIREW